MTAPALVTPRGILLPVLLFSAPFVFLNFALPVQTRALGASALAIGGLFSAFTVTLLLLRPLIGWGLDRWGRRRFFLAAGLFYLLAMVCFGLLEGLAGMYLARIVQGVGAAMMWVAARTMLTDLASADGSAPQGGRGAAMGGLNQASVRGSMIGATWGFTLVGMLPDRLAWQLGFAGYAVLAALGCVIAWRSTPETRPATVAALPRLRWADLLAVPAPLRRLLVVVAVTAFAGALIGPLYLVLLQDRFEAHWLVLAAAFFPAGLVYALLQVPFGRWADRRSRVPLLSAGLALSGLVSLVLPWLPSLLLVALFYTLFAVGGSLAGPVEAALAGDLADPAARGRSFGWFEAATGAGASVGPLAGGLLYDHLDPAAPFALNGLLLLATAAISLRWLARLDGPAAAR